METYDRFFKAPESSFFLFGPRGTGKSTWTSSVHPDALNVNLLEPDLFRSYSARPERLREILQGNAGQRTIVIDEIQRVPELLGLIHQLIEEDPTRRFILTGSSSRKLKRTGVDLLAGRAVLKTLHPFMAAELGDAFSLEKALIFGLVPLVFSSGDPGDVLRSYAALYLKEEVQAEGIVRNVGQFSRFLESISFSHGSVLNVSSVARECEVERKTVVGYLQILEDLLLGYRVPVFRKRAGRATIEHPKFYFFDAGVFRSIRPQGPLDHPEEIAGAALEGLVAQHLRAWIAYGGDRNSLFFWRTRAGAEVDFVVYGDDGLWAVEVKNGSKFHDTDLRGLRAFQTEYPEARAILLYRGREKAVRHGISIMPCEDFLCGLKPGRPLPSATR
ncbi:MAG: AAA family ATPase [Candidatus Aminicenantes bacterium]|nr:AAA family ATPase [Candidatus Aminicenantes bacterium]